MTAIDERQVFADLLGWLLEECAAALEAMAADRMDVAPVEGATPPAALGAHVLGATRAYVLGLGCGEDVERDRPAEFAETGASRADLAADLRQLRDEVARALAALDPARLDEVITPPQHLFGEAPTHELSRRWAIASAIRHCGIHLGHLQLTRDVLGVRTHET